MDYQIAQFPMTLNDLEVIHLLQAFSDAIWRTYVQHLTTRRAVPLWQLSFL